MKKINWSIVNLAFWTEAILCYLLPFQVTDGFRYQVGFPITFMTIYDTEWGINPLMAMHVNPLGLAANAVILYLAILLGVQLCKKWKGRQGSING